MSGLWVVLPLQTISQTFQNRFTIKKTDVHLSEPVHGAKCSPVTLAFTGSSCSFLFLPNIRSILLAAERGGGSQGTDRLPCAHRAAAPPPVLPSGLPSPPVFTSGWVLVPPSVPRLSPSEGLVSLLELELFMRCLVKGQFPSHVPWLIFNPVSVSPTLPLPFHFWLIRGKLLSEWWRE